MKKFYIFLIFFALLGCLFFLLKKSAAQKASAMTQKNIAKTEQPIGDKSGDLNSIHTPYEMKWDEQSKKILSSFSANDCLKIIDKFNSPVDFFGRVVDQNENGIEGVKIDCLTGRIARLDNGSAEMGRYKFSIYSDSDGRFHISGFAANSLIFISFSKEGYLIPSETVTQETYVGVMQRNTKESPTIFYLWKSKGGVRSFIKSKDSFADFNSVNAGFREIVLSYGQRKERREFGKMNVAVNANLEELANIAQFYDGKTPYDWSATIEIPDGGILLTQEPLPYLAPEKGYAKKVYIEMRKDNPKWTNRLELKAYVHNEASGLYSRWEIAIYIGHTKDANGVPQWNMSYTFNVNPDGSRILEPNHQQ